MYIRAPTPIQLPIITKGKVPKIKKVKWHEAPEFYRKERWIDKVRPYAFEAMLYVIGIAERGRTLWTQWSKKGKSSKTDSTSERLNGNRRLLTQSKRRLLCK